MACHPIERIVESLVSGGLDVDDFMRAVQKQIEDLEADAADPEPGRSG
jgi:hypothetical protein